MKVLVIGQTPPPYHGQAMMTHRLIHASLKHIKIYHIRMSFSESIQSMGTAGIGKILHMFSIVGKAIYYRFRYRIAVLYYMPAGPNLAPVIRDIFMLTIIRLFYPKTIFHFRAAGLSLFVQQKSALLKLLARYAYRHPNLAIHLSALNPDDGGYFKARRTTVVQNGLEDAARSYLPIERPKQTLVNVLFVGILSESKGVMVLLQALSRLLQNGHTVKFTFVGEFISETFKEQAEAYCQQHQLEQAVDFAGLKKGDDKWQYFVQADIFCFPSYYESESFGNVVVEAMMFELPVVATRWRGVPDIVDDGKTGTLVAVKAPEDTAVVLSHLISNHELRIRMGKSGREKYLLQYQLENFLQRMESAFQQVL